MRWKERLILKKLKREKPKASPEEYVPARDFLRPYMVLLMNCQQVLIEGVTLRNSPKFVLYPNTCTDVTIRNANIYNEWWAQNGDGIDISACNGNVFQVVTINRRSRNNGTAGGRSFNHGILRMIGGELDQSTSFYNQINIAF